jgi:hypothetical protein
MRYLISVIDDTTNSATGDEVAAIDRFNELLRADGHWVFAGGLASPDTATVIDNRQGSPVTSEGPFLPSEEYPSGFWVIDAPDRDTALGIAADASSACHRRVELRPFLRP